MNQSRMAWVRVSAIACFAVLLAASAGAQQRQTMRVTFDRTVLLPTVSLAAGTYTFERQGTPAAPVVIVFDAKGIRVSTTAVRAITRPEAGDAVVFEQLSTGATNRIAAWYATSGREGYAFIYP